MPRLGPDDPTLPARPAASADASPTKAGTVTFGRFQVLDKLGEGGMGAVYAALDPMLNRRVAIKVLRRELSSDSFVKRMVREAQALARLSHPNVVGVHDVGFSEGQCFVAMEYVEGVTLDVVLADKPPLERVLELYLAAGHGLAAAHAAGLVHRDFKPLNVMVGRDGRARVLDFGLVRDSGEVDTSPDTPPPSSETFGPLTQAGSVMGTPGYMSPEQARGRACDARSDQFSFCVSLWQGLYAQLPYPKPLSRSDAPTRSIDGAGPSSWVREPPPSGSRPVPAHVHAALERGLSVDPQDRFSSMDALLEALRPRPRRFPRALTYALAAATAALWLVVGMDQLYRRSPKGWWARNRAACNPVRVTATLDEARAPGGPLSKEGPEAQLFTSACLAQAGEYEQAEALARALPAAERERAGLLFYKLGVPKDPTADSRLTPAQVPIMELALAHLAEREEEHARAAYFLGLAAAKAGQGDVARAHLEVFLREHPAEDAWRKTAQAALQP